MEDNISVSDLDQLKLKLTILKGKISLAQDFLKQVQDEVYSIHEIILDHEDLQFEKIQLYINQL